MGVCVGCDKCIEEKDVRLLLAVVMRRTHPFLLVLRALHSRGTLQSVFSSPGAATRRRSAAGLSPRAVTS